MQHRWPGGSSSGGGVAVSAQLCAFAIGSDTGGSIRVPAAFNGVVGHKSTTGTFGVDGVFPLSTTLDTLGTICQSAMDAAAIHTALTGSAMTPPQPAPPPSLAGVRLGRVVEFCQGLDPTVYGAFAAATADLRSRGAEIVDVELATFGIPFDLQTVTGIFQHVVGPEVLSAFGIERYERAKQEMDSFVRERIALATQVTGAEHAAALKRMRCLARVGEASIHASGCNAWICPTVPILPGTVAELDNAAGAAKGVACPEHTRMANFCGLCAVTVPIFAADAAAVGGVGLQLIGGPGADVDLLALAAAVEQQLDRPPSLDLSRFDTPAAAICTRV
eukprot:SAG22_NODE_3117_length_1925_cov_8.833516_2_plen_333_part_00